MMDTLKDRFRRSPLLRRASHSGRSLRPATARSEQARISYEPEMVAILPLGVLCGAAAVLLFWRLGERSLADWDEAIYAQIAKEIVRSGEWLTLHWGYTPFFEKPPLLMWSTAVFFHLFGVNEFWARAASALSGIAVVALVYLIGRRVYDWTVGFFGGAILLSSSQFVASARFGTTDVMLTMWILLAVYSYLRVREGTPTWWYAVWIPCALAVMTKSAAGLVAPMVIGAALLLDGRLHSAIRSPRFWGGIGIAVSIVLGWHATMYLLHGQRFVEVYFGRHLLERATSSLEGHVGGRDFYLDRLRTDFFPWFYLLPFAVALSVQESIAMRRQPRIILLLVVLVFGLYTLVGTKIHWYIVPMYPALALLVARTATEALRDVRSFSFAGLIVASTSLALLAPRLLVLLFGVIVVGALMLGLLVPRRRAFQGLAVGLLAFFTATGAHTIRPLFRGGFTPVARLAQIAGNVRASEREPLLVYHGVERLYKPTPLFYSNRPIEVAWTAADLRTLTLPYASRGILLARKDMPDLAPLYRIHVLHEADALVHAMITSREIR